MVGRKDEQLLCTFFSSVLIKTWVKEITSFLWKIQLNCRLCCSRGPLSPLLDTVSLNLQYHYYFLLLLRNKKISNQEITNLKKTPIKSKTVVSIYKKNGIKGAVSQNSAKLGNYKMLVKSIEHKNNRLKL